MLPVWRVNKTGSTGSALTVATADSGDASRAELERESEVDLKE